MQNPTDDSQVRHDRGGWISGPSDGAPEPADHTTAGRLAWLRDMLPPGYEADAPSAPGAPWTWTAPGGDCGAESTADEVLSEARHHRAAKLREEWAP